MMREAGVDLLLHAYVLDARVEGDTVRGASFATVGGVRESAATVTIDATADAFVAAAAGVPTPAGRRARSRAAGEFDVSLQPRRSRRSSPAYVRAHPDQMRTSLKPHERTRAGAYRRSGVARSCGRARAATAS